MFSIKRFDASTEGDQSSQHAVPDQAKLDALNERIAKKRKLAQPASGSTNEPTSSQTAEQVAASVGLKIHPSRLNAAPALRQSFNRAVNGPKEKTKAKQRYLKAKKQRRKAKKKSQPKSKPGEQQQDQDDQDTSSSSSSSSTDSDPDSDSDSDSGSASSSSSSSSSAEDQEDTPTKTREASANDERQPESEDSAEDEPKTPVQEQEQEQEEEEHDIDGLPAFPSAGRKKKSDPALIRKLGLPEGMTNRTVIDPTLSKPLSAGQDQDKADQLVQAGPSFANVKLSQSVRQRLEALGISSWFAVQVSVIPSLLSLPHSRSLYRPYDPPRDLCVSAPTGSGKTLAYSVPIVEVLRTRQITRLRALIVLPTRDLVSQVRSTIELIAKGSGLRIATATGHHSFAHEQTQIMGPDGTEPQVDILIATPGRLIDHLDTTPGFSLAHLRFLVIDEADRLLSQSFHEWLGKVLDATENRTPTTAGLQSCRAESRSAPFQMFSQVTNPATDIVEAATPAVQKLLFSATLTRDPAKIAALGLRNPHYISIQDKTRFDGSTSEEHQTFSLPHTLREHMLVTSSQDKPLRLLELVHRAQEPVRKALVFTKSVESAARLVKLIEFYEEVRPGPRISVRNYSSELRAVDRQRILAQFGRGEIDL